MSSSSAYIRALSPSLDAISSAIINIGVKETTEFSHRDARQSILMGATSVVELIEFIPAPYRSALTNPLHALVNLVHKLHNSRATLAKYREHQQRGTWPPQCARQPPSLQFVASFADTEQAAATKRNIDALHLKWQQDTLSGLIAGKNDEVAALELETSPQTVYKQLQNIVGEASIDVFKNGKIPEAEKDAQGNKKVPEVLVWEVSAAVKATRDICLEDCVAYAARVVSITGASLTYKSLKFQKKREVADAARTAAGDMDVDQPEGDASLRTLVEKTVASQLSKAQGGKGNSSPSKKDDARTAALKKKAKVRLSPRSSSKHLANYFLGQVRRSYGPHNSRRQVRPSSSSTPSLPQLTQAGNQERKSSTASSESEKTGRKRKATAAATAAAARRGPGPKKGQKGKGSRTPQRKGKKRNN
jgi:hypothetical protein